ncbi:unnamed protein product [Polarella glacialis]|uniref:Uncharacterized protein n=1 Tax=Polarella glacialis TaxID=89957 RepID=A0A813F0R9_POLGL|nr:unnamed protein product [Polarella glacialis]
MTRESEGRGVSSRHPIKTLPKGRFTTEQKKNEGKHQPNQKKTPTGNKRQTKSHNKRNTTKPHGPTKRERETTNRKTKRQPKRQTPQNSECNLKISVACERAHSKLLTYNTGDEVTSDDCGHHRELRKSNTRPKLQN